MKILAGQSITSVLFGLTSYSTAFSANVTLVIDGKPFQVQEAELPDCSSEPELVAMKLAVHVAYSGGVTFAEAACLAQCTQADCESFCKTNPEQVLANHKTGLAAVFSTIRRYPPYFKNDFCAQGRQLCEDKCNTVAALDEKRCSSECNQYERYYRK